MKSPSIQRRLMVWVLGALGLGAVVLVLAAYLLTLREIDELLDDSLRQTALLLADRDLSIVMPSALASAASRSVEGASKLVVIARRPDGSLLFASDPERALRFDAVAGASLQPVNGAQWHVFTVVRPDRVVQVARPTAVGRQEAAEAASQLLVPLLALIVMIAALLVFALRRGMKPLRATSDSLAERSAHSLVPLDLRPVPQEVLPLVQALNDLLRRLAAAFEAQRHFIADAAHELRTPVTALQLQIQLLQRSRDAAERALAVAELSAGVGRARRLIEQLLDLSRAAADDQAGVLFAHEMLGLGDLARTAVARWSREAERRQIDLGAVVSVDSMVQGDRSQLEVLMNNLIENALRYTPGQGVVDVVAHRVDATPTLSVFDNGPGIGQAERGRVFDRFYRGADAVAGAGPGSGLGLAIVKAIAERHRATVSLHAGRDGRGLEVRMTFPGG